MSFSGEVKDELMNKEAEGRHCKIAELTALLLFHATVLPEGVVIRTENRRVVCRAAELIKKIFDSQTGVELREPEPGQSVYCLLLSEAEMIHSVISTCKLQKGFNRLIDQKDCCKRSFLRGAFLSAGSVNNPEKNYHFEIACEDPVVAGELQDILNRYELDAKIVERKRQQVVYLKEGAQIVDALNLMGAHRALMEMENVRVLKEVRNQTNRKVNCDIANINKTIHAAGKQLEDIRYIKQVKGLKYLNSNLREVAELRLNEPELTLKELGENLNPPVSKSGVNHRLKKIGQIADDLRATLGPEKCNKNPKEN